MAAGPWLFTDASIASMLDGTFNVDGDTFKMALHISTGTQPAAGTTAWSALSDSQCTDTGYTAGGEACDLGVTGTDPVTVDIGTDPVWTAGAGGITAKWAVIYEVGGNVLCYCLLESGGANVTATEGNTLTVAAHTSGVFTVAKV